MRSAIQSAERFSHLPPRLLGRKSRMTRPPQPLPNCTCNNPEECEKVVENVGDEVMSSRQDERPGLINNINNNNNQEVIKDQAEAPFTMAQKKRRKRMTFLSTRFPKPPKILILR